MAPPVFQSDRPLIFAHRGGARLAPENTMPAIDNGMALGADGLEIDTHLSVDGIPVVIHDPTLDRSTRVFILSSTANIRFEGRASVSRVSTTCWRSIRMRASSSR